MSEPKVSKGDLELMHLIPSSLLDMGRLWSSAPIIVLVYTIWLGLFGWASYALPAEYGLAYLMMAFGGLCIYCLYSLHLFSKLLVIPRISTRSVLRLVQAVLLFGFLIGVMLAIATLFFTMVGASIGIVSGTGAPSETEDIVAQMHAGGTFWPIFAVFVMAMGGMIWFISRLALFSVATAATGAVHIFRTWSWTRPAQFTVLISVCLLSLMPYALYCFGCEWLIQVGALRTGGARIYSLFSIAAGLVALPLIWVQHALAVRLFRALAPAGLCLQATTASSDRRAMSEAE